MKASLKDDEPRGSREASSPSSPRSAVLGMVPEPIEGRKKSKESLSDGLAPSSVGASLAGLKGRHFLSIDELRYV